MNMNSSLDRRYSFNNTQIHPVAESTCVNWNGNNSQGSNSFRWGSPVNSPKQRNNLNSIAKREQSSLKDKCCRGPNSDHSQDNGYKIEPRIYADVQSKGLSSRIVKYHESGARLNRSMSAYNLNCKPGQFPLVHLKKTPLPIRAIKHTLSMTYIPPPEKSTFQGNTLCGLLRSNSVLGLHKNDDDISHENRPILHPPPTKDDLAPTRSVLDVLKEISRKRINSEDLSNSEAAYNFKRQRDININTYAATQPCAQVLTPQSPTASPEQPKKRLCHYNNDITSSLSSSIKRKLNDKKNLNQTTQSNNCDTSLITQRTKMLKQNSPSSHTNIDHLRKQTIAKITPITPIPDTPQILPCTDMIDTPPRCSSLEARPQISATKQTINDEGSKIHRLTLFNKNYDETTMNEICDRTENREGVGQCVGIQFVKPKKLDSLSGKNNPLWEKNKKSKLARMLRSLKGELYHEEEERDKFESIANRGQTETDGDALKEVANMSNTSAVQSPESSANVSATATFNGSLNVLTNKVATTTTNVTEVMTPASVPLVAGNINKTSPLVGIKLTPQKPLDTAGLSIAIEMKSSTAPVINNPSPAIITGFSFGSNACTVPSTISQTLPSTTTTILTNSAPLCNFSFGSSKIVPTTTTTKTTITPHLSNTSTISCTPNLEQPLTTNTKAVATTTTATVSTASSTSTTISLTNNLEKEQPNFNSTFGSTAANNTQMTLGTSTNLINFDSFTSPTTSVTMQPPTTSSGFNFTPTVNNVQPPITFSTATTTAANAANFTFTPPVSLKSATPFTQAGAINANKNGADIKSTFAIGPNNTAKAGGFSFAPANNTFAQSKPLAAAAPFSFGGTTSAKSDNTSKPFSFGPTTTPPRTVTDKTIFNHKNSTPAAATTAHTSNTFNTFVTGKTSSQSTFDSAVQPSFASLSNNAQTRSITGTTNTNTNASIFGSNINNTPAPAFGSTNNSTFFPSVTATTAAATNPTSSDGKKGFSFGSVTNTNTSFGGLAGTKTNSIFAPKPTNAATSQTKSFSFGSNAGANNANLFKDPFKSVSAPPSKGGFAFGSAAVATPLTSTSSAPTPNSFTFTNNPNPNNNFAAPNRNNSAPPPFSFAATTTTTTSNTAPASKPFSFGSTAATASKQPGNTSNGSGIPATNIFGNGSTPAAPAFNFGRTTPNTTVVPQNMFASGSNSPTTTVDRPIRRATRRLQKS